MGRGEGGPPGAFGHGHGNGHGNGGYCRGEIALLDDPELLELARRLLDHGEAHLLALDEHVREVCELIPPRKRLNGKPLAKNLKQGVDRR